jgi:hypothetical protein
MDGDDFSNASARFGTGIDGRANGRDITPEGDCDQSASDLVLLDERDVRRFECRI